MANETSNYAQVEISANHSEKNATFSTSPDAVRKGEFVKYWKISLLVLHTIIFVISTVGNGLVCFVILRRRAMKTVVNYLILNLAIADLIFTCICIPFDIPVQYMDYAWPYGATMCKIVYPIQTETLFASVYTLVALSLARYWAVVHPLKRQLTTERVKWAILVIWAVSFIPVTPYMAMLRLNRANLTCGENWKDTTSRKAYTLSLFLLQYIIPLSIISCAHFAIGFELTGRASREKNIMRRIHIEEARKVSRMLITVTFLFAACVLPNNILWLWLDFGAADKTFVYFWEFLSFGNIIVFSNSALNPICYTMMNEAYKKEMRQTLMNCLKKKNNVLTNWLSWQFSKLDLVCCMLFVQLICDMTFLTIPNGWKWTKLFNY